MHELFRINRFLLSIILILLSVSLAACAVEDEATGIPPENTAIVRSTSATSVAVEPAETTPFRTPTTVPPTQKPMAVLPIQTPTPGQVPTKQPTTQPAPTMAATDEYAQEPYLGIWLTREELGRLPMSGPAWEEVVRFAGNRSLSPDLNDQDDVVNIRVLANALLFARTGDEEHREKVVGALETITYENTEKGGNTLALGRELAAYVIAADLINLPQYAPQFNAEFEDKLRELLTKKLDGRTLTSTNEERPNNWGTHAGASRAAVALYLGDTAELRRTAQVFQGWLGNRGTYADFIYGDDLSWHCDPDRPLGINPQGCEKDGHDLGGAQPEEMRRGAEFQWPPEETGYAWEALQGALVQAEILHRAGYDVWNWEDQALLRAVNFLYDIGWHPEGDDEWLVWLINSAYCTSYQENSPTIPGKNMGFTDWTHAGRSCNHKGDIDG